jgi:carboxymethylenebutenolidase
MTAVEPRANETRVMIHRTAFTTPRGRSASGDLSVPRTEDACPGLVIVHEWWGLNDGMREMAERFAASGFLALAVDLFGGATTAEPAEAKQLAEKLETPAAMDVIAGAASVLATYPHSNGHVGVTGFCLGGAMALAAACNVDDLAAAVVFYGTPKDQYLDFSKSKAPILGHYAKSDAFVSAERVETLRARAEAVGARFDVHFYDAGHAFMRKGDPEAYDEAAASLAWERTIAFLRAALT